MRAVPLVKGGSGREGRDVTRSAALLLLALVGAAVALIVEACCG